jgi:hypothetical protein
LGQLWATHNILTATMPTINQQWLKGAMLTVTMLILADFELMLGYYLENLGCVKNFN